MDLRASPGPIPQITKRKKKKRSGNLLQACLLPFNVLLSKTRWFIGFLLVTGSPQGSSDSRIECKKIEEIKTREKLNKKSPV